MDMVDGIIVGAAAAAIGTIVAFKFLNRQPIGGGQPLQINTPSYNARGGQMSVIDLEPLDGSLAPIVQANNPNTEAAYNQYPIAYAPAFGPLENQPAEQGEVVLPS